jgi:hypothetical protein
MSHDELPYCGECGVSHDPVCGPSRMIAVGLLLDVPARITNDEVIEAIQDSVDEPFSITDTILHPDPEVIFPSEGR